MSDEVSDDRDERLQPLNSFIQSWAGRSTARYAFL